MASKDILLFASTSGRHQADFFDETGVRGEFGGARSWSGVAVLVAFLASLAMLTGTVFVALYKKRYLCQGGGGGGGGGGDISEKLQFDAEFRGKEEVRMRAEQSYSKLGYAPYVHLAKFKHSEGGMC